MFDVDQIANLLARRFIQRTDVKAWQFAAGGYVPERKKITRNDLRAHIKGERSMGHYLLDADSKCKLFAFDIDLPKPTYPGVEPGRVFVHDGVEINPREEFAKSDSPHREALVGQLVIMAEGFARRVHREYDIPVAIAFSGNKGCHVYGFTGETLAVDARGAAVDILTMLGIKPFRGNNFFRHDNPEMFPEIEVFPKQNSLDGKDLGNLMRLPLGRNLKGKESCFLRVGGDKRSRFARMDPVEALKGALPWTPDE